MQRKRITELALEAVIIAAVTACAISCLPGRSAEVVYKKPPLNIIKGLVFITQVIEQVPVTKKNGDIKIKKVKHKLYNYELLTGDIYQTSDKLKNTPDLRAFDDRHRKIAFGRDAASTMIPVASFATPFVVGATGN